jgi:hypothetical protein
LKYPLQRQKLGASSILQASVLHPWRMKLLWQLLDLWRQVLKCTVTRWQLVPKFKSHLQPPLRIQPMFKWQIPQVHPFYDWLAS